MLKDIDGINAKLVSLVEYKFYIEVVLFESSFSL